MWQQTLETIAYARSKKGAEAEKARAAVEQLATKLDDLDGKNASALARGAALIAKGDAAGAAKQLRGCEKVFDLCTLERLRAEDAAGLKTDAAATRADLTAKGRYRTGEAFYVWTKAQPAK